MLEATVDEEILIQYPTAMTEPLNGRIGVPLGALSVVNVQWDSLSYLVGPTPDYQH